MKDRIRQLEIEAAIYSLWGTLFIGAFLALILMAPNAKLSHSIFFELTGWFVIGSIVAFFLLMVISPTIKLIQLFFLKNKPETTDSENFSKKNHAIMAASRTDSTPPEMRATIETAVNTALSEKAKEFLTKEEFMKDYLWKLISLVIGLVAIVKFIK